MSGSAVLTVAVALLAFNDLRALLPLGELSQDAFIYVVPILMLWLLRMSGRIVVPSALLSFAAAFGLLVLLGVGVNYPEIASAYFKGRSGFGRVLTQAMTFGLGLWIMLLFYNFALLGVIAPIVRGARVAILVMAAVGLLEFASWFAVPGLTQLHVAISTILHAGSGIEYAQRLRTTAFEVSWAAVMLAFFFPFATLDYGNRKSAILAYSALVLVLVVLAQSRTALLVIGFQLLMLAWYYLRQRVDLLVHVTAAACMAVLVLMMTSTGFFGQAAEKLSDMIEYGTINPSDDLGDENVSNVTRAASIRAAQSMFLERPLLGVGFGQFGFHYPRQLGADDFRSYEVRKYASDASVVWPPAYSIHVRLLAEIGLPGYLVWLGFILLLLARSIRCALHPRVGIELARTHLAVAMTLCGLLLLGSSIDSFRFFGGWIAMGIALGLPNGSRARPIPG